MPLKHSVRERVPRRLAAAAEADDDGPALRWDSCTSALSRLKIWSPEPPAGPTRHWLPSSWRSTDWPSCDVAVWRSVVGSVVLVAPGVVVVVSPGTVEPVAAVVGVVVTAGADVDGEAVVVAPVVGVVGVCVGWYVSRAMTERPKPAGATLEVVAAAAVVVVAPATVVGVAPATVVEVALAPVVVVAPATVVVVAPGVVVVVVAFGSGAAVHPMTGRKVTMPATSTASSAWRWSFTPGRSTTMLEPSTRTSGSAMPRFSSSSRIRSRMTRGRPLLAPASAAPARPRRRPAGRARGPGCCASRG